MSGGAQRPADSSTGALPPAPWRCRATALLWVQPTDAQARKRLPSPLVAIPWLPLGLGGVVFYHDTPVGPYHEVFAALPVGGRSLPAGHVPFMAVDSATSVQGGRRNWALPKVLAGFAGTPADAGGMTVRGDDWVVTVGAAVRRRALPLRSRGACAQLWPDGSVRSFAVHARGTGRPATVAIRHVEGSAEPWLPAGRRPAVLFTGELDVRAPRG